MIGIVLQFLGLGRQDKSMIPIRLIRFAWHYKETPPNRYTWTSTDTMSIIWDSTTIVTGITPATPTEFDYDGYRYFRGDLKSANTYEVGRIKL